MVENEYGGKFEELRNKAEEVLRDKKESGKELGLEIDELIHELEVHQIELEMQNEDLIIEGIISSYMTSLQWDISLWMKTGSSK